MISAIRNKFGSRLLDFFIWLAIITFVILYLIPGGKNGRRSDEWVVQVNGEKASLSEYSQMLANRRKMDQEVGGGRAKEEDYKKQTLDMLTEMLLMQSLEKELNIVLAPEAVRAKLEKLLPGMVKQDGQIDVELLQAALLQNGRGADEIQEFLAQIPLIDKQIASQLKNEVINGLLIGAIYLPKYIQDNHYNGEYALKQFAILTAPYSKYAEQVNQQKIDDAQLKAFFDQENLASKRYWSIAQRSGEVWSFTPANFGIKVTEKQIKNYYDQNRKNEFVKEKAQIQVRRILFAVDKSKDNVVSANEKAGKVRAELANDPTKFEELARANSDDQASAAKGGLMDFFNEGSQEKAFNDIAFELRTDGEISEIFETSKGVEIIQRVAKKPIEFKPLKEVEKIIEQKIISQQFEKLFPINARRIIAEAVKNPEALTNFINAKKGTKKSLENVKANQTGPDSLEVDKLFELKKVGLKGSLVKPNLGEIIVLTKIEDAQPLDFNKIKATVLADYKKELALKEIKSQLEKANNLSTEGKNLKEIAKQLGLDYEQTDFISREGKDAHQNLIKKQIPLDLLWSLRSVGAAKTEISGQNGYLVKVEAIKPIVQADFDSKKKSIVYELFNQYRLGLDSSFIASLRKNGTISLNTTIINA